MLIMKLTTFLFFFSSKQFQNSTVLFCSLSFSVNLARTYPLVIRTTASGWPGSSSEGGNVSFAVLVKFSNLPTRSIRDELELYPSYVKETSS